MEMEYASRNIFLGVAGKKARQGARVSGYDCALSIFYETQHTPLLSVKCCRVSTVTRYNKDHFAYESSVPSAARADSYAEHKTKINYRVSDCFVECYARALSLIVPPYPLSVGTTHSTKGLFRALKWVDRSLPRSRERMRVGVAIRGQGYTPHSGSAMA